MEDVRVDVSDTVQNRESVVDIVKVVLRGLDDIGIRCNGFNLHYKDEKHLSLDYIQFHSLMPKPK